MLCLLLQLCLNKGQWTGPAESFVANAWCAASNASCDAASARNCSNALRLRMWLHEDGKCFEDASLLANALAPQPTVKV